LTTQNLNVKFRGAKIRPRRIWKYAVIITIVMVFINEVGNATLAQRTTSGSTRRGFNLSGDVKVDESQGADPKPAVLDVILYTKGEQLVGRQRISPNGRYRFMDLFDGDYYIVVEMENKEVARVSLFISATSPTDLKQDIALEWRAIATRNAAGAGVVSAANSYYRSGSNKLLYQKSAREIDAKDYSQAAETLRELVAADPRDFPAWADLGMIYFVIQKDFEAAENSYLSALKANEKYFPAMLNLGRVRIARKNYEGAIQSLEGALSLEPKSAPANYFLGEAYLQIKKGSKAVVFLKEALNLDPIGMADAHLRLAQLYNAAGMKDKAATEYEQFLKKKPDYKDREKLEKYISENKSP
jgi:Tfp pilus assembly protein PilF